MLTNWREAPRHRFALTLGPSPGTDRRLVGRGETGDWPSRVAQKAGLNSSLNRCTLPAARFCLLGGRLETFGDQQSATVESHQWSSAVISVPVTLSVQGSLLLVHNTPLSQSTAAVQHPHADRCEVTTFETDVKSMARHSLGCTAIDVKKRPVKYAVRVARWHDANVLRLDEYVLAGRWMSAWFVVPASAGCPEQCSAVQQPAKAGTTNGGKSEIRDSADQLRTEH